LPTSDGKVLELLGQIPAQLCLIPGREMSEIADFGENPRKTAIFKNGRVFAISQSA
jgi:hypothetical protein